MLRKFLTNPITVLASIVLGVLLGVAATGLLLPGELAVIVGGVAAAQGGVGLAGIAATAAGAAMSGWSASRVLTP